MERLKSEQNRLCAWLSEDPDYIVDQCGDILSMNECKEVQKQTSTFEKIRVLLGIIINKGGGACQSFMDILQQNQDHYKGLQQFFNNSAQGPITPMVVSDKCSIVSINELKDTSGKSFSNKIEVVNNAGGGLSGLVDGHLPQASYVATGGSVIMADRISGVNIDGDIGFSVCVKPPEACTGTVKEAQTAPQGAAVRMITEHKMELIDCLRADLVILQHAQARKIITDRQYQDLKETSGPARTVTDLLDVVIGKGQETCNRFLQLLKEADVLDTYPQLRDILNID